VFFGHGGGCLSSRVTSLRGGGVRGCGFGDSDKMPSVVLRTRVWR
jgi:hypothetical protein